MLIHAISQHQNQDYNLIQIYDKDNGQIYDIDDTFYDTAMILNNVMAREDRDDHLEYSARKWKKIMKIENG